MSTKIYKGNLKLFLVLFLVAGFGNSAHAQKSEKLDSAWNSWNFRVSPYFWYIGLKGSIENPPRPVVPVQLPEPPPPRIEFDLSFKDIQNSIKFAYMFSGQFRKGSFITQFNSTTLILETEAITPLDLVLTGNKLNLTYSSGDLSAGYRIVKTNRFEFDALLGLKFIYNKIKLTTEVFNSFPIAGERSKFWADPVLAANFLYRPHRKLELLAYGDFGIGIIDTDYNYQFFGGVNYLFTKWFFMTLGYRTYHVKFDNKEAIYNGTARGFFTKIGFQF